MRSNEFYQPSFLSETTALKAGTSLYAYNIYFDRKVIPVLQEWVDFYYKPNLNEAALSDQEVDKFFQTLGQYKVAKELGSDLSTFEPFKADEKDDRSVKDKAQALNAKIAKMLTNALNKAKKAAQDFKNMSPEERQEAAENLKKEFEAKFEKLRKHANKEGVGELLKKFQTVFGQMFPKGWQKDPEWWREFGVKVIPIVAIMAVSVAVGTIGGPWAARFVAMSLKAGLKFLQDGEIDAKTIAVGAGMALAAGEITSLIGGVSDVAADIDADGSTAEVTDADLEAMSGVTYFEDDKLNEIFNKLLDKHKIDGNDKAIAKLKAIWDANLEQVEAKPPNSSGWKLNTTIHWIQNTPLTPDEYTDMIGETGKPSMDNISKVRDYMEDKDWTDERKPEGPISDEAKDARRKAGFGDDTDPGDTTAADRQEYFEGMKAGKFGEMIKAGKIPPEFTENMKKAYMEFGEGADSNMDRIFKTAYKETFGTEDGKINYGKNPNRGRGLFGMMRQQYLAKLAGGDLDSPGFKSGTFSMGDAARSGAFGKNLGIEK